MNRTSLHERFGGPELDLDVWFPHYLPHWSSRAETRARYELIDDGLRLFVPRDHPRWCAATHEPALRVSGIASGSRSGPIGSTDGPQAFRPGLTVAEEQPHLEGWLPSQGHVEVACRMTLSPRSMAAVWLAGFEDEPGRAGELCVVEVFGKDVDPGRSAEIGVGHKQLGDPDLVHDFDAPRISIDVADPHTYSVDWDGEQSVFRVDGIEVKRCFNPPTYAMQAMVAVFDFPDWTTGDDDHLVPELVVHHIAGSATPAW